MMWREQTAAPAGNSESGKSAGMKTASTFLSQHAEVKGASGQ
jgi:hypothetical protein